MKEKRLVLIIEDNVLNGDILATILEDDYEILRAYNGQDGLELVRQNGNRLSVILLDIHMPIMDGYAFMDAIRQEGQFTDIPIIVTTAHEGDTEEIHSLEAGASDFVTKPYNANVVKKRIASIIRLRETSAMLHRVERDTLTGLLIKEVFFLYAAKTLKENPGADYDLVCFDFESFKLINDRYGIPKGDELLKFLAEAIRKRVSKDAICGRVGADVFAILRPHRPFYFHRERAMDLRAALARGPIPSAVLKCGIYKSVNPELPVQMMCDNAILALESIKNHYGALIAEYDESIRRARQERQEILDNMESALSLGQFRVYYQPKYNLRENWVGGAEALVRWIHPKLGFMDPGKFIPLFEQNGFIYKLDTYILEEVCRDLRRWLDQGLETVPISVNVSRTDFDVQDLDTRFAAVVDRYNIPHELIHFEITESTYAADPRRIMAVVEGFHRRGFLVELDDFGSGYSSMTVLGEMPIDILKLDMSLLRNMFEPRHKCVLTHVIAIANSLGMKIVAEGVETREQSEELKRMGEGGRGIYGQGYYFSRPIPCESFEEYLRPDSRRS